MKRIVKSIKKGSKPGWVILAFEDGTHGICATDTAPFFGVGDEIDISFETRVTNGKEWNLVSFPTCSDKDNHIMRTSALKSTIEHFSGMTVSEEIFWRTAKIFENFIKTGATPQNK